MYTVQYNGVTEEFETVIDLTATPVENLPNNTVSALAAKEALANKGVENGYAGLDENAEVPLDQLPAEVKIAGSTSIPRSSIDYVVVVAGDNAVESGANLLAANALAKTMTPTAAKPVTVIIPAGVYDLGTITDITSARSDCLFADTAYINYVGIGNPIIKARCELALSSVIYQTVDHIGYYGFTVEVESVWDGDNGPRVLTITSVSNTNTVLKDLTFNITGDVQQLNAVIFGGTIAGGCTFADNFTCIEFTGTISGNNTFGANFCASSQFSGIIRGQNMFGENMFDNTPLMGTSVIRDIIVESWDPSVIHVGAILLDCRISSTLYTGTGAMNSVLSTADKGVANGVAPLGADSKIAMSYLPAIGLVNVFEAADEAAQLALTAQTGDVAVRLDENKTYMRNDGEAGDMTDWTLLQTPTDVVLSVAGEVGVISANDLLTALETNRYSDAEQAKVANLPADTNASLALKTDAADKGQANGHASLNELGLVPLSELPATVMDNESQVPVPVFVEFTCPTDIDDDNLHFQLQIASDMEFTDLIINENTSEAQTNWKLYTGTDWEDFPADGVESSYYGEKVSFITNSLLFILGQTYYARYRAWDGTAYTDWRGALFTPNAVGDAVESMSLTGANYVFVTLDGTPAQNAVTLQGAFETAGDLTPNDLPLAADNRAGVIVLGGVADFATGQSYDVGEGETVAHGLVLLDEFVDLIALNHLCISSQIDTNDRGTLEQYADDVRIVGIGSGSIELQIDNTAILTGTDADPAAYFPASNLPSTILENITFVTTHEALPTRAGITYSGVYRRCNTTASYAFGYGATAEASGTFEDCTLGDYAFNATITNGTTGIIRRCHMGSDSLSQLAGALIEDCIAGDRSFGYNQTIMQTTFRRCTGLTYCFGCSCTIGSGSSLANRVSFEDCRGTSHAFGHLATIVNAQFLNCYADDNGFGWTATSISEYVQFINCHGQDQCFGTNIMGTVQFKAIHCTARDYSFAASATFTGEVIHCTARHYSFGYDGVFDGIARWCNAGNSSYGNNGTLSGTLEHCVGINGCCDNIVSGATISFCVFGTNFAVGTLDTSIITHCKIGSDAFPFLGTITGCTLSFNVITSVNATLTDYASMQGNIIADNWSLQNSNVPRNVQLIDATSDILSPYQHDVVIVSNGATLSIDAITGAYTIKNSTGGLLTLNPLNGWTTDVSTIADGTTKRIAAHAIQEHWHDIT